MPGADALTIGGGTKQGAPAHPQNLNRYSYVTNNPLTHTDPTGHCGTIGLAATAASVMSFDCTRRAWDGMGRAQGLGNKALLGAVAGASAIGFAAGWAGLTIGAIASGTAATAAAGEAVGLSQASIAVAQLAVGSSI